MLVISTVALSACNNKTGDSSPSSSVESSASATATASGTSEASEAADPFGKYDQAITINIGKAVDPSDKSLPAGDTPENNEYTRYIKENLNIDTKIAWTAANGNDYDQKVNLSIASNSLPDALVVNDTQLRQMVKAGMLEDLTQTFNDYASPLMKELNDKTEGRALQTATFDGKLYGIPGISVQADGVHTMWIRKDWLDKLGLEVPKTLDDLEKVAKAFVEQDPDGNGKKDTFGISGPQSGGQLYATFLTQTNNTFGFDPIFSSLHSYPGYWLKDANGQPAYGSIQPETKEALAKLRDFYSKGLVDPEMSVRKDATEPVVAGKSGIFFGPWWMGYWPLPDAIKNDPKANWQSYTLPLDANGRFNAHMPSTTHNWVVVRKGYEHPEVPVKMLNLLVRDEGPKFSSSTVNIANYPLRVVQAAVDESEFSAQALRDVLAGTKQPSDYANLTEYKLLKNDLENIKKVKLEPYDKLDLDGWNPSADLGAWSRLYSLMVGVPYYTGDYDKVYSLIYSQTKTMESRWANLKKLEDETFLKIIMGASPLDDFDKFVADWKKQGGDLVTQEVAEAVQQ
ncbi:extracellular solute-binding protein [Cohnella endophytica]|uniref:Extracellular solute-binding protein n=2 Tax=Cohnella endophytica TaxID=2419778 RepID=A0A494XYA6_9BACL|nr:extracellular solute-binding protein [Cohnella endophytica]